MKVHNALRIYLDIIKDKLFFQNVITSNATNQITIKTSTIGKKNMFHYRLDKMFILMTVRREAQLYQFSVLFLRMGYFLLTSYCSHSFLVTI